MVDRQVRALVGRDAPDSSQKGRDTTERRRSRRRIGIALASLIVLGSAVLAAVLLLQELRSDDDQESTVVITSTPDTAAPADAPAATTTQSGASTTPAPVSNGSDPFAELRYLPAGFVSNLQLQAIVRTPSARPLASYVRTTEDGRLTGTVFLDLVEGDPFVQGVGVRAPKLIEIAGVPAEIAGTGPSHSHVIRWDHPELGTVRAWGVGTTRSELIELVDLVSRDPGGDDLRLPESWMPVSGYEVGPSMAMWRSAYMGSSGEVAVVMTAPRSVLSECDAASGGCPHVRYTVDDDQIMIATFASIDRVDEIAELLRPTTNNNRQIITKEFEPLVEVPLRAASDLLFVPAASSEWQVTEFLAHMSGEPVTEPALVLVEREVPEIGQITSAVAVYVSSSGQAIVSELSLSDETNTIENDRRDLLVEVAGWRHSEAELNLISELITVSDEGVIYASRAAAAEGLERRHEAVVAQAFPRTISEGVVFGATVVNDSGDPSTIRVSSHPGFVAETAAIADHENERVTIPVRGRTAALLVADGTVTLTWEEEPELVIVLEGTDQLELVQLAEALQLVNTFELDPEPGS